MSEHQRRQSTSRSAATEKHPRTARGQSLLEFAVVLPIALMLFGGIVQYGVAYAANHALIQVGRDVGRWAATQPYDPCSSAATAAVPQPVTEADRLAVESGLPGYSSGEWLSSFVAAADNTALPAAPPHTSGVEVVWSYTGGEPCPPVDSTTAAFVTIRLTHEIPVILPGFQYLPGFGTCVGSDCYFVSSTTSEFRLEPGAGP